MRYLVTGAGLIGSAIAQQLAGAHEVLVLDREERPVPDGVEFVRADIRELEDVRRAARGAAGIFHTAALHGIHLESHSATDFMQVNVLGTCNVLEAATLESVPRVVHSSTSGVFGSGAAPGPDGFPRALTESTPQLPLDHYGNSKVLCEELCGFYARARGLSVVALRYGGVRQLIERLTSFDLKFALSGGITDADDAVTANLHAMERLGSLELPAYNVLPTTLFDTASLRTAGDDLRGALLARLPWLPPDRLPQEVPRPSILHDAAVTERDLGFKLSGDQPFFIRLALGLEGVPTPA
jgi:nucleoside-diphosphate-sugar epimerase